MKVLGWDRPRRVTWRHPAASLCAAGLALGLGSAAAAAAASELGPVSQKVLAVLNAGGQQYVHARRARPAVGQEAAVRDALANPPWPGCATGISLMRTTNRNRPSGRLVWLVSVHPTKPVLPAGGGPRPGNRHGHTSRHAADYFVVVVSARSGREVEAQDGFSAKLATWKKARPSPCEGH